MFVDSLKGEGALHLAVLQDDIPKVIQLAKDETLLHSYNSWGFTPLELAQFLGKKECMEILNPIPAYKIHVRLKGENIACDLSSDEFQKVFGVVYCSTLRFESYPLLKEVLRNCPWILRKSSFGQENRELGNLYREQLSTGFTADLAIKWINERIGYGLFASEDIHEGAFVGEYTGQVRRLFRWHPDANAYCFHYPTRFWSWKYFAIDSWKEGNAMRFINHSDQPNLQPMCLVDRGLLHHVFFAKRQIKQGYQLTFDYGEDYWMKRKKIENVF